MRAVEARIEVSISPEAAVDAFLDLEAMRGWWHVERGLVQVREGGVWALAWERSEHGFKYVITGRIASLEPRRLLITEMLYFNPERPVFGPMSLAVDAAPTLAGCELTVRQDGYGDGADWDWYYRVVRWAWPEVLKELKEFLER
jgi:activator of Hsp90 ATPase-like protein